MRVPLDEANASLGLNAPQQQQQQQARDGAPLLTALHPNRQLLALARGPVLSLLPVLGADGDDGAPGAAAAPVGRSGSRRCGGTAAAPGSPVASGGLGAAPPTGAAASLGVAGAAAAPFYTLRAAQNITSLAWLCVLTGSRQLGAASLTVRPPELGELLESECLLVGTQDGTLQLHDGAGRMLFRQRLHTSALEHISVRPCTSGLHLDDPTEDVTLAFTDAVVRLPVLELRTHLKLLQLAAQSGAGGASVAPLSYHRWDLPAGFGPRSSAVCLGPRPRDLDALLSGAARGARAGDTKLLVATAGFKPVLGGVEIEEHPQRGALARLKGVAGSVTSGVYGAASKAATLGPSLIGQGVRSLTNWVAGPAPDAQRATAAPAYDLQTAPKPELSAPWRPLRDEPRRLGPLSPAPAGPLLAGADNLGRVLLVNGATMSLVRMWKGYRDAQCGWALPPEAHPWARFGLLLVIYAPRRDLMEIWSPRSGARIAAARVEGPCRLLPVPTPCGGWQNELLPRWQARSAPSTLVLRLGGGKDRGALWDVLAHAWRAA